MTAMTGILSGPATYLHWGVVQVSLPNLLVVLLGVVLLVLAVVVPFPHGRGHGPTTPDAPDGP